MASSFANRHKVRGWKRRLRQLERLEKEHLCLDLESLYHFHYHFIKLQLDPWNRLVKRNPPFWFRHRVLQTLFKVAKAWQEQVQALDAPCYLAIWIFHPCFYQSQVVVAIDERVDWYEGVFPEAQEQPMPADLYGLAPAQVQALTWKVGIDPAYEEDEATGAVTWIRRGAVWVADGTDNRPSRGRGS